MGFVKIDYYSFEKYVIKLIYWLLKQINGIRVIKPDLFLTLKPVTRDVEEQRNYRWFNLYLSHFLKKLSAEYTPLMLKEKHRREGNTH